MFNYRQEQIIKDIEFSRRTEPKKVRKIVLAGMSSYFKALKTFGPASPAAKEALRTIKEMLKIHRIEDQLLLFIGNSLEDFDIYAVEEAMQKLDNLNTNTFDSYYDILHEIDTACEEKDKNRQLRPEDGINSLLTNNRYKTMVLGLATTFEDIKEYLPYEEEFWTYLKEEVKPKVLHTSGEGAKVQCGVVPYWNSEDGTLGSIDVHVPRVTDYETAMEAIRVYKRAHDLYLNLGKKKEEIPTTNANEEQMQYREDMEELANKRFR